LLLGPLPPLFGLALLVRRLSVVFLGVPLLPPQVEIHWWVRLEVLSAGLLVVAGLAG
jgi:hypothetical protein